MYRRYGRFLRERLGSKVYKVSVDAGFTCPTLDGSKGRGGCTYCNNASFRAATVDRRLDIAEQVRRGTERQRARYKATKFLGYFQNYTNTYAPAAELRELYETVLAQPDIVGLSISTRPDCLDADTIALLAELSERTMLWLEVGLESSHDATLERIQRGHDYACFTDAIARLAEHPSIILATHLIFGLPGEDRAQMLETVERVAALPLQAVKMHHLHVVKGSLLAREYAAAPFPLMSLEDYTSLLCEVLPRLPRDMVIMRLFGECPEELLIGPHWPYSKAKIQHHIEQALTAAGIVQGSALRRKTETSHL